MSNSLCGKSVLVSGAAGFLGSHVTRALLAAGASVIALVRPTTDLWRIEKLLSRIELTYEPEPADFAFHLAAAGVLPGASDSALLANISLTRTLLEFAEKHRTERFLYAGSCAEYPAGRCLPESTPAAPHSYYGVTKAASSMLVNTYAKRLHVVALRLFTIYGPLEPRHRLIPAAIEAALCGGPLPLTPGKQTRDFVYVEDAARAFLAAATAEVTSGETINIATGEETRVRDVVVEIYRQAESPTAPVFGTTTYHSDEYMQLSGDPSKAERLLGWNPRVNLEAGIAQAMERFTVGAVH